MKILTVISKESVERLTTACPDKSYLIGLVGEKSWDYRKVFSSPDFVGVVEMIVGL